MKVVNILLAKYLTLLFAAACSATSMIDSGETVRKKPAI